MADVIEIKPEKKLVPVTTFFLQVGKIGTYNLYLKVNKISFGKVELGATANIAEAKQFKSKEEIETFILSTPDFKECIVVEYPVENFA